MIRALLWAVLLLVSFGLGCSGEGTTAASTNASGEHAPAQGPDANRSDPQGIVYVDGCEIPMPPKAQKRSQEVREGETESGAKVNVSSVTYFPEKDFEFVRDAFVIEGESREVPEKRYKLVWLKEHKVKGKVFGFTILAEPLSPEEGEESDASHSNQVMTVCYDTNGDGRFEHLIMKGKVAPKVPDWVG